MVELVGLSGVVVERGHSSVINWFELASACGVVTGSWFVDLVRNLGGGSL